MKMNLLLVGLLIIQCLKKMRLTKKIKFSHNPFSMPQGDINKLDFNKPLNIKAYQYDIVCNGVELSSGAIRNPYTRT